MMGSFHSTKHPWSPGFFCFGCHRRWESYPKSWYLCVTMWFTF